ncbi:MAG: shikimate dehydrogenase [Myxococcota bacterium]|jgi:shikimate dehydrogenase|nr:shikimate dehydrogenase [Myxococcota bacterium]
MRPIGPRTQLCGVVLHPAGHTRSPAMHNAAFAALDIDAVYVAFDVPPPALPAAVAGARALGVRQLAVSIPHKEAMLALCDEVDATARRIGAVNTVTLRDGRFVGTNTDWIGVVRAIERSSDIAGRDAVVLGAGGAARAAVFGLRERGARVRVLNRTRARAEQLAAELGATAAGTLDELGGVHCDLLVNTTSVGLREDASPVRADAIPATCVVLDAVYDPARTRLLRDAEARGARTIEGKWWLVHQAAEQIRAWTGADAPIDSMAQAFSAG